MLIKEPEYYDTLDQAVDAFVNDMEQQARNGPLVRSYAFIASDGPGIWFTHIIVVGEADNVLDRAMWGAGSYAAAINAEALVQICDGTAAGSGDYVSHVIVQRRNAETRDAYTFRSDPANDSYKCEPAEGWIIPAGHESDEWGHRDHTETPSAFWVEQQARGKRRRRGAVVATGR